MKVYWASVSDDSAYLAFSPITSLNHELREERNSTTTNTFFSCSGFNNALTNTFIIKNPITAHLTINENGLIYEASKKNKIKNASSRPTGFKDAHRITLNYGIIFYSPDSVELEVTPPYMHNTSFAKYGAFIPGMFDISKWFRTVKFEVQLWQGSNTFELDAGEPLFYAKFHTDEPIEFIRFNMSDTLISHLNKCTTFKQIEPFKPLSYLYDKFVKSHLNKHVMKEIQNNISI